jgi:hypothetical protein
MSLLCPLKEIKTITDLREPSTVSSLASFFKQKLRTEPTNLSLNKCPNFNISLQIWTSKVYKTHQRLEMCTMRKTWVLDRRFITVSPILKCNQVWKTRLIFNLHNHKLIFNISNKCK